jgi:hypothetical protein
MNLNIVRCKPLGNGWHMQQNNMQHIISRVRAAMLAAMPLDMLRRWIAATHLSAQLSQK